MNTGQLKPFAQKARNIIREGVSRQLKYWGFDEKGSVTCRPEKVEGGIIHREEVMDDTSVLKRWESLLHAVKHQGFDQVVEEAAYTWFNRIMAIQILSKNKYDLPQLEYGTDGAQTPMILQRARRGQFAFLSRDEQTRLRLILSDYTKDTHAFAILLTGYCHSHTLLNNVFGRLDDFTELLLPVDMLSETGFIHFLNSTTAITDEDYRRVELIGWLYQFYISEKKDQVFAQFKKNQKAEAKDIPAATQIFTPNWIVKYMVENTVGKIWLDKHPHSPLKAGMKYLVEAPQEKPGTAEEKAPLIDEVAHLKLLDPAAGSGHILVEGFELLYQMYLEEYYMPEEAVESILKNNLFGLDIDLRAAQLARFAILMKAASKYPEILQKNILPKVFAMPAPANFSRQEILDFLGSDGHPFEEKLTLALQLMQQAQNLGSVMKFDFSSEERNLIVTRLEDIKNKAFRNTLEEALLQKIAPFTEVLDILIDRYEAIATNPPYLNQKNYNASLREYLISEYPLSKSDLFAVFMEVCLRLNFSNGKMGMINQNAWMFLSSYEKLRVALLDNYLLDNMIHLGTRAFDEMKGEKVQTTAFIFSKEKPNNNKSICYRLVEGKNVNIKHDLFLKRENEYEISQLDFKQIPGNPFTYWANKNDFSLFEEGILLDLCPVRKGIDTGKNDLFLRNWQEVNYNDFSNVDKDRKWFIYIKGGSFKKWYGNLDLVVNWENNGEQIKNYKGSTIRNLNFLKKEAITWSLTGSEFSPRYIPINCIFDNNGSSVFPKKEQLFSILGLLISCITTKSLSLINPTLAFQVGDISRIPIKKISAFENHNIVIQSIKISKNDNDNSETSWNFQQSPLINENQSLPQTFQKWQQTVTADFYQLHTNEEELNRIFLDIYGFNEEMSPLVHLRDITILQEELDTKVLGETDKALIKKRQWKLVEGKWQLFDNESLELPPLPIKKDVVMKQLISYTIGCLIGRYRLDQPGLHIAHPNPTPEEVCTYTYNGYQFEIDDDAIVPLMGANCTFADDAVNRFNYFLEVVWGAETLTQNKNFLVDCLNQEIEKYLVKDFWGDHCRTYKKKPIYWLFASEKGAFQVLVYMHRMNRFTAEKIRSKYLLKHLQYLQQEIDLLDHQSGLSREEQKRQDSLHTQCDECVRYELLLKDCADRQIDFDLDDGVTVNYELFKGVVAPIK